MNFESDIEMPSFIMSWTWVY